jgi:hypothetical protein
VSSGRASLHPFDPDPAVGGETLINQPPDRSPVREVWKPVDSEEGDGLWDANRVWFDYEPTTIPVHVGLGKAHEHQLRFRTTAGRIAGVTPRYNPVDGSGRPRPERPE